MSITLSADEETIQRSREYAQKIGTSVNQLVRDYLQSLTLQDDRNRLADEFICNATGHSGRSREGFRFDREAAQRSGTFVFVPEDLNAGQLDGKAVVVNPFSAVPEGD